MSFILSSINPYTLFPVVRPERVPPGWWLPSATNSPSTVRPYCVGPVQRDRAIYG